MSRLPPVDPDFLIDESDPDTLNEYANGLWERLQYLKAHPKEKGGYNIETVKAATVWLIGRFVDAKAPIPYELYRLVDALIKPKPRVRTGPQIQESSHQAYWSAIKYEAQFPPDPRGKMPSTATLSAIARHIQGMVGTGREGNYDAALESLKKSWRKSQHYRDNVSLQRGPAAHFLAMRDRTQGKC